MGQALLLAGQNPMAIDTMPMPKPLPLRQHSWSRKLAPVRTMVEVY